MKNNLRLAVLLLNLMTNAPPETRFFLLVWAAHVEKRASSKVLENLIAMGMPKRCIPSTLEYLVREGFMWKVKSSKGRTTRNKYLGGFDFSLTDKCFSLFQATLDRIIWTGEFLYLLNCPSIAGSNTPKNLNLEMRLIWVWLVTQSNPAGFIVGFDHQTASAVLGMPVSKVMESFNSLLEKNHVAQLSINIPRSKLFDELLPIYKIYPAKSDRKIIELGISHDRLFAFKSLSFLIHMSEYHSKASERSDQASFPTQTSDLLDTDYYELSEILANHDLIEALQWRSILTMLQVIPEYASFIESGNDHSFEEKSDFIWDRIYERLVKLLPESQPQEWKSETPDTTHCDTDNTIQYPTMWEFTLRKIMEQLTSDIRRISPQWNCYRKMHDGSDVQLVGYSSDAQIVVRLTNEVVNDKDPEQLDKTTNCVGIKYSDAFEVLVPVDIEFQSGVTIDDQFLASIPNRMEN